MNPLDKPAWSSLTSAHRDLGEGGALARRYAPDVNLFASTGEDTPEALSDLADLLAAGDQVFILQVPEIIVPSRLAVLKEATGVQMVFEDADLSVHGAEEIVALDETDAAEMLALATLTEPGPFLPRTHLMGQFWGVHIDGRLAAMAGERMRFPGFTEVSGVCTHPDFRGRGLARRLSAHVARQMIARGDRPFLHAWKSNAAAIGLYESLGFKARAEVNVVVLTRENTGSV
jgi:predicted GNAT family acetyltransferase